MRFDEVVQSRRSVRSFASDPVPRDVLERVVGAALVAPSARGEQPWRFHVTTGDTRRELGKIIAQTTGFLSEYVDVLGPEGIEKAIHWYSSLGDAPAVIAVSVLQSESEFEATNRLLSVGASIENLLLAAVDAGLGACPVTFSHWVRDEMAELLGIGPDREVVAIVALGRPSGTLAEPRNTRDDVVEWYD